MRLVLAICVLAGVAAGQPRFSVASVKAGGDNAFATRPTRSVGRIQWRTQLCYLIGYAYNVDFSRITGAKCGSIYEMEATFDPKSTENDVREMVQGLLAERFHLRVRRAAAEADGHALVVGKGGSKLPDGPPEGESRCVALMLEAGTISITGRRATMGQLATTLGRTIASPVWDRTGLSGNYDFEFRFAQNVSADAASTAQGLGTALGGLGLRLDRAKGTVDTVVIEHVEQRTAN